MGVQDTAFPQHGLRADHGMGSDQATGTEGRAGADHRMRADLATRTKLGPVADDRGRVDAGNRRYRRMKQPGNPREAQGRIAGDEGEAAGRQPIDEAFRQQDSAGLGGNQAVQIAAIVEVGDIARPRFVQRGDAGEAGIGVRGALRRGDG